MFNIVRVKSPAPTRRTIASPTWTTMNKRRSPAVLRDIVVRAPPPRTPGISAPRAVTAGITPNKGPETTAMESTTATTRPSNAIACPAVTPDNSVGDTYSVNTRSIPAPKASPARAPSAAKIRDSHNTRLASRARPPPSAARVENSSCRPATRTNCKLATLAHAISSRNPIAPNKTASGHRALAPTTWRYGDQRRPATRCSLMRESVASMLGRSPSS